MIYENPQEVWAEVREHCPWCDKTRGFGLLGTEEREVLWAANLKGGF